MTARVNLLFVASLAAVICSAQPSGEPASGVLVLSGGTVIDGSGADPIPDAVVVVKDERIEYIGPAAGYDPPADAAVLDTRGRWLIPGLADMHAHVVASRETLQRLLAFGVTTVRTAAATEYTGVVARDRLRKGEIVGPRMFTAGPMLDGPDTLFGWAAVVETPDEVRDEVRRQAAFGVDFVKLYVGLDPELVAVAIEEAHALGVDAIGHLGRTGWSEAAELGIDTLEHSGFHGPIWELSGRTEVDRADFASVELLEQVDLTGAEAIELARTLSANAVFVDPTLVLMEAMALLDDPEWSAQLEADVGARSLEAWRGRLDALKNRFGAEAVSVFESTFPSVLAFVRLLHESDVSLLAGTDVFAGGWTVPPGTSLHRELELLHRAGIPASQVLTIATRNAAEALGRLEDFGTLEAGKLADIVVLNADPIADIRNTREIERVVQEGRVFDPEALLSGAAD